MHDDEIVDSGFTATINAPLERIDLPRWCFSLREREYQGCSPAHVAAGATTAPDGRRMSINVEVIGGSLMVQGDESAAVRQPASPRAGKTASASSDCSSRS